MSDIHKSLRLGDLLVEKGLITRLQLRQAIEIQQALQSTEFGGKNINAKTELGEILIELGFISRHQLQSNLNWQRRLKATTAVMVFIAPLLTAACGGGASGSTNAGNVKNDVASSLAPSDALPKPDPVSSSSVSTQSSIPTSTSPPVTTPGASATSKAPVVSSSSSSPKAVSSSSKISAPSSTGVASSKSVSSSSKGVSSSSVKSSSLSSSSSSRAVDGSVQLYWSVPTQRENGDYLDITEIGGYELRYKAKGDANFTSIRIADGFIDAYYFNYLKGEYQFQIATFDKDGLYSNFVDIDPS